MGGLYHTSADVSCEQQGLSEHPWRLEQGPDTPVETPLWQECLRGEVVLAGGARRTEGDAGMGPRKEAA